MADPFDTAQELEQLHRQHALKAAQSRQQEPAQDIDEWGLVHCIDCSDIIPHERLAIKPNAARCITCQQLTELQERC